MLVLIRIYTEQRSRKEGKSISSLADLSGITLVSKHKHVSKSLYYQDIEVENKNIYFH